MANDADFHYPYDVQTALEPWRHRLGGDFDSVVTHLAERDRAMEDYASTHGTQTVTSTTRPVRPTLGQHVYESDTGLLKVWDGVQWSTETNLRMFGAGFALTGGAPPAVATGSIPFRLQAGTNVYIYATGGAVISFPAAFPNGVLSVVITGADAGGSNIYEWSTSGLSTFTVRMFNPTNSAEVGNGVGPFRVNWIAVGW